MSNIDWPDLYCPFPVGRNEHTDTVAKETVEWAKSFGLIWSTDDRKQLLAEKYTLLAGRFFPKASLEALQLFSDWTSWLFWHDDVCDESEAGQKPAVVRQEALQFGELLAGRGKCRPNNPFDGALQDMRERLAQLAPGDTWMVRFLRSAAEYFEACVWEAENRAQGLIPTVNTFIALRRCTGGMWMYCDFVELANARALPLPLRAHRDMVRLTQITCNVACWHNDLFSVTRESRRGDVHNLVTALEREYGTDFKQAARTAAQYADAEVHSFLALCMKLPSFGPELQEEATVYLSGLKSLMRGNLDWSMESGRYTPAPAYRNLAN